MSRRSLINMTDEEVQAYLSDSRRTMSLISNGKNGFPHPMPMWYTIDADGIISMTTFRKSQKVKNIRRDPRVTLMVESGDSYPTLKSVLIYANAEVIDDLETTTDVLWNVGLGRGDVSPEMESKAKPAMAKNAEKRVTMRFHPVETVTWDHNKLGGKY